MTQKQDKKSGQNGVGIAEQPNPEVLPKAERRTFTAKYKLWVLEEADKCEEGPGKIGALLRREGLYSSHLATWRRQREAGQLAGLRPKKRGRKAAEREVELSGLKTEIERLEKKLSQAELVIEAQKKLSELLGITLKMGMNESN